MAKPKPLQRNIFIYQGDTFEKSFRFESFDADGATEGYVDFTGATGQAEVREEAGGALLATITVAFGAEQGVVDLRIEKEDTDIAEGVYFWDLEIDESSGDRHTYMRGAAIVTADVTEV